MIQTARSADPGTSEAICCVFAFSATKSEQDLLLAEDVERLCVILTTGLEMWPFKSHTSDGCHSYH